MKDTLNIIDKWGIRVLLLLTFGLTINTCTTKGKVEKISKNETINNTELNEKLDSLVKVINTQIKVEGLRSEKRMIQSTDRKIFDVNRQTEIDKEIEQLIK